MRYPAPASQGCAQPKAWPQKKCHEFETQAGAANRETTGNPQVTEDQHVAGNEILQLGPERFLFRPRRVFMVEGGSRGRRSQLMECSSDQALQSTLAILTRVRPEDLDGPRPAV